MYDSLITAGMSRHQMELFTGYRGDGSLITNAEDAAAAVWELINRVGAEALVMDTRGFDGTEDEGNFWINVYDAMLKNVAFVDYKCKAHFRTVFWSRYLNDQKKARLVGLGVREEDVLDRYGGATPRTVLARLSS